MKKTFLLSAAALLSTLLAAPAFAYGSADDDWGTPADRRWSRSHDRFESIQYLREKLHQEMAERRHVEWTYNQARLRRDWPTVRFERGRLDRLDDQIEQHRHELHRAYEYARRNRHDHDAWRGDYGYRYN
ncbi:MAG: hypothetical protein IPP10_09730 [Candidatus Competibacteraceae bacterium]|nr:hypothetical protein [Candidatus Competibacteraceae bacterium]MBK7982690.1 hypothetical protein [Candidatus Competibacteraceae bacterium]MBK8898764.1 hypothetical protein [Candidatus Competibacteraceae bacterium]MBK8962561.1 hypothetical protein [Candidatus Competibacteraceae bacterium]MBK9951779.1 hypothetical protein [Candidatus Competibacteraceae bacterium]